MGVLPFLIELQARWQTDRANGERTVQRTMIHTYSEIRNMKETLKKPSQACWTRRQGSLSRLVESIGTDVILSSPYSSARMLGGIRVVKYQEVVGGISLSVRSALLHIWGSLIFVAISLALAVTLTMSICLWFCCTNVTTRMCLRSSSFLST